MSLKIILPPDMVEVKQVPVYNLDGSIAGSVQLPLIFSYPVRKDLIRRAFISAFTGRLQPKGRDPLAGKRRTGESWGINYGLARVPRLDNGRAVIAPMTRGGRLAHPPRVNEKIRELINKKEKALAIISALAATSNPAIVRMRGHIVNYEALPVIITDEFEDLTITSEAKKVLKALKLWDDIVRAGESIRIRAGKGKMRGRKYKGSKSVLAIISNKDAKVIKALRNLPGVDVVSPDMLNIKHLAPGGVPGRLTIITLKALDILGKKYEVLTF